MPHDMSIGDSSFTASNHADIETGLRLATGTGPVPFTNPNDEELALTRSFAVTYDYLCPFSRIVNETIVAAVADGADWDVTFIPFSLSQTKIGEDGIAAWDRSPDDEHTRGIVAHQWGIAVRDNFPGSFPAFHRALYAARFDDAGDVDDEETLRSVAESVGLSADDLAEIVAGGKPRAVLAESHREAVDRWAVFGVPTVISGDEAVFARLMERNNLADIEAVLDMLEWTNLNEFKRTRIPR